MGAYLSEPITDKDSHDGTSTKYAFGSSGMQGWRTNMEDAHIHQLDYQKDEEQALFCVFDGHGGQEVAKFCEKTLPAELAKNKFYKEGDFGEAMRQSYLYMDELLLKPEGRAFVKQASKDGGGGLSTLEKQTGIKLSRDEDEDSDDPYSECGAGCTAVGVLIKDGTLFVANAGDSRIVLCRGGTAVELSTDHKPELQTEKERIMNAGGYIENGRVNGNLNLTRAIGDFAYKKDKTIAVEKQIITANADILKEKIQPEDEFLVLGCDGIWERAIQGVAGDDQISQKMCDFIKPKLDKLEPDEKISTICEQVVDTLLSTNVSETEGLGCDNMTCMIVDLMRAKRAKGEKPGPSSKPPGSPQGSPRNPKAATGLQRRLTVMSDEKKEARP